MTTSLYQKKVLQKEKIYRVYLATFYVYYKTTMHFCFNFCQCKYHTYIYIYIYIYILYSFTGIVNSKFKVQMIQYIRLYLLII